MKRKISPLRPLQWIGLPFLLFFLPVLAHAEQVVFSEIHYNPKNGKPEYLEIRNLTATVFDIAEWRMDDGVEYTFPSFNPGDAENTFLEPFERILLCGVDPSVLRASYTIPQDTRIYGPWTGSLDNAGERLALDDKNGTCMAEVEYDDDGRKWPVAADGAGHSLRLVRPNHGASDWRNWSASKTVDGTPGSAPAGEDGLAFPDPTIDTGTAFPIVELGSVWKHDESGTDLGTAWREPGYDDTGWATGPGVFGKESKVMPGPGLQTNWLTGVTKTYYLRKQFDWNGGTATGSISVDAVLDDGMVVYLNGQELGRYRMPAGAINHDTSANSVPTILEATVEENVIEADVGGILVQGTNTLAVEVHNATLGSSDVIFGPVIRLSAEGGVTVINEVRSGTGAAGFIEFYNPTGAEVNLRDHSLSDDPNNLTKFPIASDLIVPSMGFAQIGYTDAGFAAGNQVTVYLTYSDGSSILDAIDAGLTVNGPSLGRKPSGGTRWFLFDAPTPGEANIDSSDLGGLLALSEIHIGPGGNIDWVELSATTGTVVPLDGLFLASTRDFANAQPLTGSIPPNGYRSFDLDFPVEPNGNFEIFLITEGNSVLAAQKFDRDFGEESFQSVPPGAEWFGGPGHTRDSANNPSRNTDIVINEIMYDPPSDSRNTEYVELYNRGATEADLTGWRFVDAIGYEFPAGTTIAPGAFLVVAANAAALGEIHGGIPVVGDFSGRLRDGGELLRLEDATGNLADQVDYRPSGDWPELADGDGSSMELKHPMMDNDFPSAWADSDETQKTSMQTFTYTADFEQVTWRPITGPQELHAHLVGDAHVIISDVSLRLNGNGPNLVNNPSVMSPTSSSALGWVCQGTHWASFMNNGELNLISDGHGDNKANRAEIDIGALTRDQSYTLSFDAQWVSGKSRIIFQTLDHGFGTSFRLPIPENVGTPGAPNSRLLASPAPTLNGILHQPAVPTPMDPAVKVTTRIASSAALDTVELVHRLDTPGGNGTWLRTAMHDDGAAGGDEVAGDGIYTATVTQYSGQANIVQFYVEASATGGSSTLLPKLGPARPAMWIVDGRTIPETLLRERLILSQYDRNAMSAAGNTPTYGYNFPRMSNHFFNATIIHNEEEIRYNAEMRKSGSPFTRDQQARLWHGKWKLPGDRLFRERRRSVFDPSGVAGESNNTPRFYDDRIARYFLYLLGHPTNEMEFVHWVVNGDGFKLREIHEPISNDFLNRHWESGSEGTLLRIDDEWQFTGDDGEARERRNADWSYKNSDNPIRYHSEWLMRTREADHDYGSFVELVRKIGTNSFDQPEIDQIIDRDLICMNAAVRGYDADWDTLTLDRGKNAYFFRPKETGRWLLVHWDGDRVFERTGQSILGGLPGIPTYFNKHYVRRTLNYYLTELLEKHTRNSVRTETWMQLEKAAVAGTGIVMPDAHYRGWFTSRESNARSFIGTTVLNAAFNITTSNNPTSSDTISLSGTSPSSVHSVRVVGQPDVQIEWTSTTAWTLSGIQLKSGANTIVVEGINHEGVVVHSESFAITKNGNAPPVLVIQTSPSSQNVSLAETFSIDASASFDPEGTPVTFDWDPPADVATFSPLPGGTAIATFDTPGLYQFSVTGTDAQNNTSTRIVEAAVFGPGGFSNFGGPPLDDFLTEVNVQPRYSNTAGSSYSLETYPGFLHLEVANDRDRPLGLPQNSLPLPQTHVDLDSVWTFNDEGIDLGSAWTGLGYNDAGWSSGPGLLGFESTPDALPAPGLQTPMADSNQITFYLRHEFQFTDDPLGSQFSIDHIIDDGAVFYLNGAEIGRTRVNPGPVTISTTASSSGTDGVIEDAAITGDGSVVLRNGTNVLAASLHNITPGSSDAIFGARLSIAAHPVAGNTSLDDTIHPWIHRTLPGTDDWALQTRLEMATIRFGDSFAGLLVETETGNARSRYGIGVGDGDSITVVTVGPSGSFGSLASVPVVGVGSFAVRIVRSGDDLLFQWRPAEDMPFEQIHQLALPAGTETLVGGVTAATNDSNGLGVLFDYLMLIDPNLSSPHRGDLIVSEIMYKPDGGSGFEFLELYNAGANPIALENFQLLDGDPFDAVTFPAFQIGAGDYALLVADLGSFRSRYGNDLDARIIGTWPNGNLSNGGETIALVDASGGLITSFSYSDNPPWPQAPDTSGASLVIVDPNGGLDPNLPSSWRASVSAGGSPGGEDSAPDFAAWMADNGFADPNAEYAGSGMSNLLAYATGFDLGAAPPASGVTAGGFPTLSYSRRIGADGDMTFDSETTIDLVTWSPSIFLAPVGDPIYNGDGTVTIVLQSAIPVSAETESWYRLRVSLP